MKLTIYTNKDDKGWLEELKKFAKKNKWSVSLAVREILAYYFELEIPHEVEVKPKPLGLSGVEKASIKGFTMNKQGEVVLEEPEKMDIAEWESKISAQVKPEAKGDTYEEKIKNCDQLRVIDGKYDCYKFNNGIEHQPFCKEHCWTRKDLWGKKVRK